MKNARLTFSVKGKYLEEKLGTRIVEAD